jgi:GNAT superfamily N-acetyltransferase
MSERDQNKFHYRASVSSLEVVRRATFMVQVVEFTAVNERLLRTSIELRAVVWNAQANLGHDIFEEGEWTDEHDLHAIHFAVLSDSEKVIAAARLCVHSAISDFPDYADIAMLYVGCVRPPIGMLGRLVVHPSHQGKGIAQLLDQARLSKAAALDCRSVMVEVPEYRRKAVEKLGFVLVGSAVDKSPIQQAGIPFYLYAKAVDRKRLESGRFVNEALPQTVAAESDQDCP